MVASEIRNDAGHAKPVHADAKAIEDEDAESTSAIDIAFHGSDAAKKTNTPVEVIVQPSGEVLTANEAPPVQHQGQTNPVDTDDMAIDDEDAESTTAIGIALHGSQVAQKKSEQSRTMTKSVTEEIAPPVEEVFEGKLDQAHEAPTAQDGGRAKPVHKDAKDIEDEDAESTTAIEVAFHGSKAAPKKSEQSSTRAMDAAEMIVQPSGEVLGGKLDQAPETRLQSKQRTSTKARRVAGEGDGAKHHSLHAAASPVIRAATTPAASPDAANGVKATSEGNTAEVKETSVLRTDVMPTASSAADTRVQWTYNTQKNKWVKATGGDTAVDPSSISGIAATFNFYLQRNLSRWKRILEQVEFGRIMFISVIVFSMIFAVWFGTWSFPVYRAMSAEAKEKEGSSSQKAPLKNDDLINSTGHRGLPQKQKAPLKNNDKINFARQSPTKAEAELRKQIAELTGEGADVPETVSEAQPTMKVRDLRAMLLKKIEADHASNKSLESSSETCSNIQVKD